MTMRLPHLPWCRHARDSRTQIEQPAPCSKTALEPKQQTLPAVAGSRCALKPLSLEEHVAIAITIAVTTIIIITATTVMIEASIIVVIATTTPSTSLLARGCFERNADARLGEVMGSARGGFSRTRRGAESIPRWIEDGYCSLQSGPA
eukprot:4395082-Pyramimonas_sp.AAC.1